MAAGGLSYSSIIGSRKFTLPSVEAGFGSMNIIKDPPKSIHTRRVNKVGQTSDLLSMQDDSGNRICEGISHYARGVNPSVSISYSNAGNYSSYDGLAGGPTAQAKLPYPIMKDGAFRPPVLRQEQILPLSRMSRVWTSAFTQPDFPDYTKRIRNCGTAEETREVRNKVLNLCAAPTATYQIEKPIEEPFEVKYVIQPTIKVAVGSGTRTIDNTSLTVQDVNGTIDKRYSQIHAQTNPNENKYINNSQFNHEPFVQDLKTISITSNLGSNQVGRTNIDDLDYSKIKTKTQVATSATAAMNGHTKTEYIHNNVELERTLPEYTAYSNTGIGYGGDPNVSSREAKLIPKINPGGFNAVSYQPSFNRITSYKDTIESDKARVGKLAQSQFEGRYNSASPQW